MATNWLIPSASDIAKVIAASILAKANENTDAQSLAAVMADPNSRANYDPTLDDRATDQIALAVAQFRGAIQNCGKQPLSLTTGSVPPEVFKHVLSLAAYGLVSSTLNLQYVISTEKGDISPLAANFRVANAYLEAITKGRVVVPPSDPTGRDYLTAINVPWFSSTPSPFGTYDNTKVINPPVEAVRFGAGSRPVDLTTFDSIGVGCPAPWWWPSAELGQP